MNSGFIYLWPRTNVDHGRRLFVFRFAVSQLITFEFVRGYMQRHIKKWHH